RLPGDIRPAEARQYDFLSTILSARRKLYLLYNSRDLQKDQDLLPAVPLEQLQRALGRHATQEEFHEVRMPLHADDIRFVDPARQPSYQDVLVQQRTTDRCLGLLAARRDNHLTFDEVQKVEWERALTALQKDFAIEPDATTILTTPANVSISELR